MNIVKRRLHLVPLWSAIMISTEIANFNNRKALTRLTNNPVEAWFGYFRNKVLKINKRIKLIRRLNPSEIVVPYYNYLSMKFSEHYKAECIDFSKIKNEDSRVDSQEEKWNFPSFYSTRNKGVYYSTKFNIANESETNNIEESDIVLNDSNNVLAIKCDNYERKNNENNIKLDQFIFFRINGDKFTFKTVFKLLNGEKINDQVSSEKNLF
jgi:hypothetical protein